MRIWVLFAVAAVGLHGPCAYEENCDCPVPGVTIRWKAAYCMALNQTDDLENSAVSNCIAAPEPKPLRARNACAQNLHWKTEVCRVLAKGDPQKAKECVRDRAMIPPIVRGADPQILKSPNPQILSQILTSSNPQICRSSNPQILKCQLSKP